MEFSPSVAFIRASAVPYQMQTFRKRLRRSVRAEVFQEYCANSSIHGVRYFDRDERPSCERFWWIVAFLLSMAGCGIMIYKTYVKWNQVPIIVTFSEKTTPVWEMQFPAITICPETKMSVAKLNFTAEINALLESFYNANRTTSYNVIKQLKAVSQLCNMIFHTSNVWLQYLNGTEDNIVDVLKNVSLPAAQTLAICIYGNHYSNCEDYLTETITEEGICYTFNMVPESEIFRKSALHTEYNYTKDWSPYFEDSSRIRDVRNGTLYARGAGLHAGLTLYLKHIKEDTDYMCTVGTMELRIHGDILDPHSELPPQGFSQGYKLMIHDPDEYPQVSMRNMRLPIGHEISIALKPQMMSTTQSAADYSWQKRQCFFNHERHLRFFKVYSQENCELECLTNVTYAMCGCVRFSMPRANDTAVCSLLMWDCMFNAKWFLRPGSRANPTPDKEITDMVRRCNCLPACSSVQYDAEITQTSLDMDNFLRANHELPRDQTD
uniref:Pickpocket n=1 Tax=Anopheles culicifacies TaxID=139723 RepID=A0A182ML87_9DIPT